jgi:short-subunit dehydrogenase
MRKVLVLGAGGQIARWVIEVLANHDEKLMLFLRHARKLKGSAPKIRRLSRAMCSKWSN